MVNHMRISMVLRGGLIGSAACGIAFGSLPAQRAGADSKPSTKPGIVNVVIETSVGNIDVAVDSARAPITAANFLRYVDGGYYDGGLFTRTVRADNQPRDSVKIGVIQATISYTRAALQFPPIPLETTKQTGLKHLDGTISMARAPKVGAQSDFFICVGDQPGLDFGGHRNTDGQGFAAFGRVTRGMDIVRAIQAAHANTQQMLDPPIAIIRIQRTPSGK